MEHRRDVIVWECSPEGLSRYPINREDFATELGDRHLCPGRGSMKLEQTFTTACLERLSALVIVMEDP